MFFKVVDKNTDKQNAQFKERGLCYDYCYCCFQIIILKMHYFLGITLV